MSRLPAIALCLSVLPHSFAENALAADGLETKVLYEQDFEGHTSTKPRLPIRDNSGWAGSTVPMRVVDSGDARYGKLLECEVSGFCQIMLGRIAGLRRGAVYRVAVDISSKGAQRPTILLRKARSGYTVYLSSQETASESMRRVSFMGRSLHNDAEAVLLMLIMSGVTTLQIDNLKVEEITGELPAGAAPVAGNLVLNSGFELLWDGWFVRRKVEFPDGGPAFEGRRAALLWAKGLVSSSWLKLSRESDYWVVARVKSKGARAKVNVGMSNYVFPRGGSGGKSQTFEVKQGDGWKSIGFRWRPPSSGKITKWAEYFVQVRNVGGDDSIAWVDGVEVKAALPGVGQEPYEPHAPLELALFTDAPQNVATKGERVAVTVMATGDVPNARIEIRDESDSPLRSHALAFTDRRAKLVIGDLPCGYWRLVTVTPRRGAAKHIEGETLLSVVPPMPNVPLDDWMYGCHIPHTEAVRDACWKLGLRWDRFHDTCKSTKWRVVQPKQDTWVFDDEIIRQHGGAGHRLIGSLATLPAWVPRVDKKGKSAQGKYTRGNRGMVDATFPLWEEYARRCAEHWKGAVDVWEVTNEPNLSGMSPADYMKILQAAYRGVKAGNKDAVVVGLGGATPAGTKWILDAIALGAGKHADALSFHGYGSTTWSCTVGPEKLISIVDRMRAALKASGTPDVPLWDSECGVTVRTSFRKFHVPHGGDPRQAARMFPKSAAAIRAAGIQRVTYYSAHTTTHAGDEGLRWLCDFSGAVKQPAVPLAVAISQLEGTRYVGRVAGDRERGVVDMEFAGPRGTLHMMWAISGSCDYPLPKRVRSITNMWGRDLPADGQVIALTPDPIYVLTEQTQ